MRGTLEVITGPMWAGKSTELIRRLQLAEADGWGVQAFRPSVDSRHRGPYLQTHDGTCCPAVIVTRSEAILERLLPDTQMVAIDEIHMMPTGLVETCLELVKQWLRVIVSGLDTDHLGRPFAPMPEMLCVADAVAKKIGRCVRCQGPSRYSQRMVNSDARILPGGAGLYEPRCRNCFEGAPSPRTLATAELGKAVA